MPRIAKEQEREYITLVRQVLVYHPDAGVLTIQKILKQPTKERPTGLRLDWEYLSKLVRKIRKERELRINKGVVLRVSELQDHYKILAAETRSILGRVDIDSDVKVNFLMKLFEKNIALFKAEMDGGIFERQLGSLNLNHSIEIDQDQKLLILKALHNFGIIKLAGGQSNERLNEPRIAELADGRENSDAINKQP